MVCLACAFAVGPLDASDRIILTQVPARDAADRLPSGSRIVSFDPSNAGSLPTNLTSGFDAAGRPDLSFDGERVLFVGRRTVDDPFDVWEQVIDGGEPRRVTHRPDGVTRAIYLSTLYTLDAEEPHNRVAYCAGSTGALQPGTSCAALHTSRMDGTQPRQITFNPHGVGDPLLLSDGRLLYAGGRPPGSGGGTSWFTVNTDGTDVSAFAAAHEPQAIRGMACETERGQVVYVEATADGPRTGGSLVQVDRARSLGVPQAVTGGNGAYRSPSAAGGGRLLVSHRPETESSYGIYAIAADEEAIPAQLFDSADWHDLGPVPVRPRPVPKGRSSVVDERVDFGFLYCLDAHRTDRAAGVEARGGQIQRLRVHDGAEILGEVPVQQDGSFYLQVPARTALRLETLDAAGDSLQAMESWIWVMPNERRGCIGCHEDRESTPPNRHVLALRAVPQRVGLGADPEAESADELPAKKGYPK
jgi:hypothetical protein